MDYNLNRRGPDWDGLHQLPGRADWYADDSDEDAKREAKWQQRLESRRLYSDAFSRPRLIPSLVLYIDGLGTSEAMGELTNEILAAQVQDNDELRSFLIDELRPKGRMISFTDNLLYGEPSADSPERGETFSVALAAATYQISLAMRMKFVRGGFTYGDLYIDDSYANGLGLLAAVKLEESVAVFPRIVLGRGMRTMLNSEAALGGSLRESPHNRIFLIDADGEIFINYLGIAGIGSPEIGDESCRHALSLHQQAVSKSLTKFQPGSRIHDKYRWVAALHNWNCSNVAGQPDLRITDALDEFDRQHPRNFEWLYGDPETTEGLDVLQWVLGASNNVRIAPADQLRPLVQDEESA